MYGCVFEDTCVHACASVSTSVYTMGIYVIQCNVQGEVARGSLINTSILNVFYEIIKSFKFEEYVFIPFMFHSVLCSNYEYGETRAFR